MKLRLSDKGLLDNKTLIFHIGKHYIHTFEKLIETASNLYKTIYKKHSGTSTISLFQKEKS